MTNKTSEREGDIGGLSTATRELDLLIAEKVMGFDRWNARVDPMNRDGEPQYYMGYPHGHDFAPEYSTDIGAAWQVVEHLRQTKGAHWEIASGDAGWVAATVWIGKGGMANQRADTAPLAICLAALKAVGVEPDASEAPHEGDADRS